MLRVSYVFAIALVLGGTAYAEDNRDKALKLFEDSNKAYKSGKFEDAADLLKKAYALFPEPLLLYNLGRAQEGLGDPEGALESYEQYLKEAKQVDDRGAIERRMETLKAQIEKQKADAEAALRMQDEQQRMQEEQRRLQEEQERLRREREQNPPPPVDDRTPVEKYGPWTVMGAGGVLFGTGLIFGIRSGAKHDDAVAAPGQRDTAELQASAKHYATIANVLFVTGGLAIAAGVGWKVWQWKHPHAQTSASVQVTPTGAAVEWVFP